MLQTKSNPILNIILVSLMAVFGAGILLWFNLNYVVPIKDLSVPSIGNDFGVFWSGAKTILRGGNPYNGATGSVYLNTVLEAGANLQSVDYFISPYYLTLLVLPLAVLPLGTAAPIWILLLQIYLVIGVVLVIKIRGYKVTPIVVLLGLGLALLWRYTFLTMVIGNLGLLLFFAIVASFYFSVNKRPYLGGAFAGLLILKPQIFFLVLPLLLIVPDKTWRNKQTFQRWLGFGVVAIIFLIYSFLLQPDWVEQWLKGVGEIGYFNQSEVNASITSVRGVLALFISDLTLIQILLVVVAIPLILGLIWLWWRNRYNLQTYPYLLSLAIALNLIITPYLRDYDSVLLLFPLLFCFFTLRKLEEQENKLLKVSWLFWVVAFLPYPIQLIKTNLNTSAHEILMPLLVISIIIYTWHKEKKLQKKRGA
jgi:hypothetical protein